MPYRGTRESDSFIIGTVKRLAYWFDTPIRQMMQKKLPQRVVHVALHQLLALEVFDGQLAANRR